MKANRITLNRNTKTYLKKNDLKKKAWLKGEVLN